MAFLLLFVLLFLVVSTIGNKVCWFDLVTVNQRRLQHTSDNINVSNRILLGNLRPFTYFKKSNFIFIQSQLHLYTDSWKPLNNNICWTIPNHVATVSLFRFLLSLYLWPTVTFFLCKNAIGFFNPSFQYIFFLVNLNESYSFLFLVYVSKLYSLFLSYFTAAFPNGFLTIH